VIGTQWWRAVYFNSPKKSLPWRDCALQGQGNPATAGPYKKSSEEATLSMQSLGCEVWFSTKSVKKANKHL
jgi:hypothetical protein